MRHARSRLLGWLANLAVVLLSLALMAAALEVLLRAFPQRLLPEGAFGAGRIDPDLGLRVHDVPAIYNKVRFVIRRPNSRGFLDVEHQPAKPPGTLRVGFFGDSYVEALQVPLDQTFFRRLPGRISDRALEPLAFGISGQGTLHSWLAYQKLAPFYDLDVAIYVFVENDPGDNLFALHAGHAGSLVSNPYAVLSDEPPGFALRFSRAPGSPVPLPLRIAKWGQQHTLLGQLVWSRISLLEQAGIRIRPGPAPPTDGVAPAALPDVNDPPSRWPAPLLAEGKELTERILRQWRAQAAQDGRLFAVLFVPQGDREVAGRLPADESWYPWLSEVCERLGIPLLDPTPVLRPIVEGGGHAYDDHWTPEGHAAIASFVARWLERHARPANAPSARSDAATHYTRTLRAPAVPPLERTTRCPCASSATAS